MKLKFLLLFIIFHTRAFAQIPPNVETLISSGEISNAQQEMRQILTDDPNLPHERKASMLFEIERLDRIKKDFTKSRDEIIQYIEKYIPNVNDNDISRWERERSLEYQIIDGEKKYFNRAAPNLFRIDVQAKKIKKTLNRQQPATAASFDRLADIKRIAELSEDANRNQVKPTQFRVVYRLSVDKNAVPEGETVRCWLPFPREIPERQINIDLIESRPERYIIADNNEYLQRSIYFEKMAVANQETEFTVVFEYTAFAVFNTIDSKKVSRALTTPELRKFIEERPPHIVFSPKLKVLSEQIVGNETNPYIIAQTLFQWIDINIPWASAREYSTFLNISDYVYENRHADCGMQTLFFITLCRMNGIPARWQSGWTTTPGEENMHDWGEIYFEPYGWVPMDVTYGLSDSQNESIKWFYLSSMDNFRLIVNDDFSQKFYPAKIHPRSETIDFQRGEVEWSGGNLYFDQWDYTFDVTIISQ